HPAGWRRGQRSWQPSPPARTLGGMWIIAAAVAAVLGVVIAIGRRQRRGGDGTLPPRPMPDDVLTETQAQSRRLLGPTFGG
ncbi:MAG TPA: hypothetical protein VD864_04575, partial [Nocardioides sp.]|nr:hypothetical protein [Nocardioides sp.]